MLGGRYIDIMTTKHIAHGTHLWAVGSLNHGMAIMTYVRGGSLRVRVYPVLQFWLAGGMFEPPGSDL
jgi:hypothetical protein